jgi:hypothetical protein
MFSNVVFLKKQFGLLFRLDELKEELALGITMGLNAWHLHQEILQAGKIHTVFLDLEHFIFAYSYEDHLK